ncbi:MAG: class I SAM-dependent methyltransferase [Desulfobacter sp.]|nr:MAG: class I SAM-dependent methyltransferase [Desulfobacter sp.]
MQEGTKTNQIIEMPCKNETDYIQQISNGLNLGDDGIWYSKSTGPISYPTKGNSACFEVEDSSFWFKHRNRCIISTVQSYPPGKNGAIFDVGGGNGFVSAGLASAGFKVVLVEPGLTGVHNAKKRGVKNIICATTDTAGFKPESLPAVSLFDVIEHIEDDFEFLRSVNKIIKIHGRLYVTAPAYSFLWSNEDFKAGHFRRYSLNQIIKKVTKAGFSVDFASYFFSFLPLPIYLFRTMPSKFGYEKRDDQNIERDHRVKDGIFVKMIDKLFQKEVSQIAAKRPVFFGSSCLVAATKKYT